MAREDYCPLRWGKRECSRDSWAIEVLLSVGHEHFCPSTTESIFTDTPIEVTAA